MGYAFENLMNMYSLFFADTQWCAVNEAYTRAFAQQDLLDKQGKGYGYIPFQFYYTVIRNNFWKQMAKLLVYFFKIEMFEATITRIVEKDHYQHNFCL